MSPVRTRLSGWGWLALLALLLAANAWLARRALAALEAPAPDLPALPAPPDLAILGSFDPFFRGTVAETSGELPVTALPLTLKGVRLEEGSGRGVAFIAGADGTEALFTPGEAVADGATLHRLALDHVVLSRGGQLEALWIDQAGAAPPSGSMAPPPSAAPGPADEAPVAEPPSDSMTPAEEPSP